MDSLSALKRDLEGCSRCSLCKWIPMAQIKSWRFAQVCPSVVRYNFHAYSGGGRLIAANSLLEGRCELDEGFIEIVYKCQLCGACQVSCQAYRDDIDLADVLLALRARCVSEGFVPEEFLFVLESLKKGDNPLGMPKAERGRWAYGLALPDISIQKVEILFHTGCRFSYEPDLQETARKWANIFRAAGLDLGIAGKDESCCGGRAYEMGYQGEMKNFAEDMKSRVNASGAKILVTPCSDCYYTFKYLYPKMGMELGVRILHAVELAELLLKNELIKPSRNVSIKATYHDPCHLGRRGESYKAGWKGENKLLRPVRFKQMGNLGVFDPPRNVLRAVPGVELKEMERIREYSWCCGAGGGVLEAYPEFAAWTAEERLEEAESCGADALVTACPWCERLFREEVEKSGRKIKVFDVADLLAMSLGGI